MKKLRRSAALLLTASMLALTACGGNSGKTSTTGEQTTSAKAGETGRRRPFGTGGFSYVSAGAAARQIRRSSGEIQ